MNDAMEPPRGDNRTSVLDRIEFLADDPTRRASFLKWFWLVSTVFVLFGFGMMLYILFVR